MFQPLGNEDNENIVRVGLSQYSLVMFNSEAGGRQRPPGPQMVIVSIISTTVLN